MPITPIAYVPRPFVPGQFVPTYGATLGALLRQAADVRAAGMAQQGEAARQAWDVLAETIGQYGQLQQAERARQAEQQANRAEAARRAEQDEREAIRLQLELAREERARDEAAARRGEATFNALPPGPITEEQLQAALAAPSAAPYLRYVFGPGTAEGPERLETPAEAQAREFREAIARRGGVVSPSGTAVLPEPGRVVRVPGPDGQPVERLVPPEELVRGVPVYTPPEPGRVVRVPGPDGRPVERLVPAEELAQGVPAYEPPRASEPGAADTGAEADLLAEADPDSRSILAQTGLSARGFMALTGQLARLPRDRRTRELALAEATEFANRRGVDLSTFASEFAGWNEAARLNVKRYAITQIAEQEVLATVDNLDQAARQAGLAPAVVANAMKLWLQGQVNNPIVQRYEVHLNQLRNELAFLNAALQGRYGQQVYQSDYEEAARVIRRGLDRRGLAGVKQAVELTVGKMRPVLEGSIDEARRRVWELFGVGEHYVPRASRPSAPGATTAPRREKPARLRTP